MEPSAIAILAVVAVLLLALLLKILKTPLKWGFKLLFNSLVGFAVLFLINFFAEPTGFSLDITWINAAVIGVFGIPGVILLLLITYLL